MLYLDAKKKVLKSEYTRLMHVNKPLCVIAHRLSNFVAENYKKDVIITCIMRSQQENDAIYKGIAKKQKRTAHSVSAAIDIRSRGLEEHIPKMLEFLNAYNSYNANKTLSHQTAIFHEIPGHGPHFHIQFQYKADHAHSKGAHANK